jgi:hypothetical protein
MTIYKIIHVATGLYYSDKGNLLKRGKLYTKKPEIKEYFDKDNKLRRAKHWEFKIKEIELEVREVG